MNQVIRDQSYLYFLSEAPELLQAVEQGLLNLHAGNRLQNVHSLMRATHTLKGASANVGLETIKKIAHTLEDAFKALYKEEVAIDPALEELLWAGYECLRLPLSAELSGTQIDMVDVEERAEVVFSGLRTQLGEHFGQQDYMPSSAELGFDITKSIFEMGVQQRLDEMSGVLNTGDLKKITAQLKSQTEVFLGLAESLSLPGWGDIAKTALRALTANPDRAIEITEVALADFRAGQAKVLKGDRVSGGQPSETLKQMAGGAQSAQVAQAQLELPLDRELEQFRKFLQGKRYGKQPATANVQETFVRSIRYISRWFEIDQGIPLSTFSLEFAAPKLEPEELYDRELVQQTFDYIKDWIDRFANSVTDKTESQTLRIFRKWSLFATALAITKFHYSQTIKNLQDYQTIPIIQTLRNYMQRMSTAYQKLPALTAKEKKWLDLPSIQKLEDSQQEPLQELEPIKKPLEDALEAIWGAGTEEDWGGLPPQKVEKKKAPKKYQKPVVVSVKSVIEVQQSEKAIPAKVARSPQRTIDVEKSESTRKDKTHKEKNQKEQTKARSSAVRQLISVDLKGIDRLNHRVGELLIGQNRQALEAERLKRAAQDIRVQLKNHQETFNQLLEWSEQLQGKIDRKSLDLKPVTARKPTSARELGNFEELAIENYSELHELLQTVVEENLQLETAIDAIDLLAREANHVMSKQQQLLSIMQDDLVTVRMLPVKEVLDRFPLMVEQLSRVQNKSVQLKLTGSDLPIDQAIAQRLYDPLLHLVRNAFDHGIEPPEVRQKQGKNPTGTIEIRAYNQGTKTIIEVRDDGRGLNIEWIRRRAIEGKFLTKEEAEKLNIEDLIEVIFEPGFSTAETVSDLSGRGIGLDVVRNQLQSLKGNITVHTKPDIGTTFTMQILLTLSIAKLMVVQAGGSLYALLVDAIEKILLPKPERIKVLDRQRVLHLKLGDRKLMVPVRQLADLMHYTSSLAEPVVDPITGVLSIPRDVSAPMLLLSRGGQRLGLEVDRIIGEQELVIRPLGSAIAPPDYIYGCSILSDGSLTLVLDGVVLMQQSLQPKPISSAPQLSQSPSAPALPAQNSPDSRAIAKSPRSGRKVLVIDDSLNLRHSLVTALGHAGYESIEAQDGEEGLERLKQHPDVACVLCDIEMPRMNGFQFLNQCRQHPKLTKLPVAMLTSHTSTKYRQLATELGAAAYLTKPYAESELLATVSQLMKTETVRKQAAGKG
jgi:chemotaxis family two-component system sensor histidine kinase/response regulator PixL